MRIAVPDLVTNSYFPALAAEELGLYRAEGVDAHVDLLAPALGAMAALRDGQVQGVVTGAHTTLTAFPGWKGAKVVVTVAQGTPWLLVLRADRSAPRGDGPPAAKHYTFSALITTEALIERDSDRVAAAVRAIVKAHRTLRADPGRATEVGRKRFPPAAAEMIAGLVERDLPFYDPVVHE